ncbi:hypothetical protein SAMN02800694_2386 [Luteibacter sp. UNCMF331Sha3.1]|uniref:hypothetical protein n=1 Tax=Luteibacter sp. UNCMF331Sha3.1 TaxID=1502760 RepID=UPI0008AD9D78|nr:hypothetical protein [Luteibacter sp. UNCMF331Sha3.1]SEM98694.1 hypothetical protein SAMN02800694_2386 [Luteibacter sp. UNCMF331Sha3.1]
MKTFKPVLTAIALAFVSAAVVPSARAGDTLLVERVKQEQAMNLPKKGMSMAEVERQYGQPTSKLDQRGGGSRHQPVINRWMYPGYIVYFERSHVIHAVLNTPAGNNTNPANPR